MEKRYYGMKCCQLFGNQARVRSCRTACGLTTARFGTMVACKTALALHDNLTYLHTSSLRAVEQ